MIADSGFGEFFEKTSLMTQIDQQVLVSSVSDWLKLIKTFRRKMKLARKGCSVLEINEVSFVFEI